MSVEQAMTEIERIARELAENGVQIESVQFEWIERLDGQAIFRRGNFDLRKCVARERNQ